MFNAECLTLNGFQAKKRFVVCTQHGALGARDGKHGDTNFTVGTYVLYDGMGWSECVVTYVVIIVIVIVFNVVDVVMINVTMINVIMMNVLNFIMINIILLITMTLIIIITIPVTFTITQ